jgi:hypothetical protein
MNSVQLLNLTLVSEGGVTPGSMLEDPFLTGKTYESLSSPKNSRAVVEMAAQKAAEPDGYSGWSATSK